MVKSKGLPECGAIISELSILIGAVMLLVLVAVTGFAHRVDDIFYSTLQSGTFVSAGGDIRNGSGRSGEKGESGQASAPGAGSNGGDGAPDGAGGSDADSGEFTTDSNGTR